MDRQPKTEPVSPPSPSHRNLKDMSIPELVKVLRHAIRMEDYDRVEEVLVSRDARLKAEIRPLRERAEMERLGKLHAEGELKKKEELCEKGKRAQESYEMLLKEVKQGCFADRGTIGELRKKNGELECEIRELRELKKKWEGDSNAVAELRMRVGVVEDEKNALGMKNIELEEAMQKNSATIDGLRNENCKLVDEKRRFEKLVESSERKLGELHGRVVRLEDDTRLLMSVDASGGGGNRADPAVTIFGDKDEQDVRDYEFGNDTGGHSLGAGTAQPPSKGIKDALGASARGKSKMKKDIEIIDLDDDHEDECTSQGLHGKKAFSGIIMKNEHPSSSVAVQEKSTFTSAQAIEMVKRKISFSDTDTTSISSSSADSSNVDNLPLSSVLHVKKKSKT